MDFDRYTQKSLEAVQAAKNLAASHNQQQLEQVHLMLALVLSAGALLLGTVLPAVA